MLVRQVLPRVCNFLLGHVTFRKGEKTSDVDIRRWRVYNRRGSTCGACHAGVAPVDR